MYNTGTMPAGQGGLEWQGSGCPNLHEPGHCPLHKGRAVLALQSC